ncbi:MAG TPA: hypothetical protein EYP41_10865 [Anaerolineae bacterium]|nr:hypothetical protein [Anaerolineae bacterium]HIP69919.1 hypothetical protein [Anaerolineae bacterium]
MSKQNIHVNNALKSALAYGAGWAIGTVIARIIFNRISIDPVGDQAGQAARLAAGLLLAFVIAAVSAGIGGLAGGYTLPVVLRERGRWGYTWRSGGVMAFTFGTLMFPLIFIVSLFSFYTNTTSVPFLRFIILFLIIGAVYGALTGLLLGIVTLWRKGIGRVVWAGTMGFGLGGLLLGVGTRQYLLSFDAAAARFEQPWWFLLGMFGFGALGGGALGALYGRIAAESADEKPYTASKRKIWLRRGLVTAAVLLLVFGVFRPIVFALADFLTPVSANLSTVMDSNTTGTQWSLPVTVASVSAASTAVTLDVAVTADGRTLIAWAQQNDVMFAGGDTVFNVSNSPDAPSATPRLVVDSQGTAHLVWSEAGSGILYSQCREAGCAEPASLSGASGAACAGSVNEAPDIAIGGDDTLMVVWQTEKGLPAVSWAAASLPPGAPDDCVPGAAAVTGPRLSNLPDGFALTFSDTEERITLTRFDGQWQTGEVIGNGRLPNIFADDRGRVYAAWCGKDGTTQYWAGSAAEKLSDLPCRSRPQLAEDSDGRLHILWYADKISNNFGQMVDTAVLVETAQSESGWTLPAIAAITGQASQPALANGGDGRLSLVWPVGGALYRAEQVQYNCEGYELGRIAQVVYDVSRYGGYRPDDDIIPYCQNRYDKLLFTPNPEPAYSDDPPTPNGAFDPMFALIPDAEYEVLFSTMWYDADAADNNDSPGSLLAQAVAELYERVKANPEQYPRGVTVRILLGNPPEAAKGDFSNQIWNVLNDLRDAGIPEMRNEALGWRLEVADFKGAFPHAHTKMLIVDGKTAVAAGYNMSYEHFPLDHPSGLGNGRNDLGIQITGPVAQEAQRAFDDLWEGSDSRYCANFYPAYAIWQATCFDRPAAVSHAPETQKYFLPGGDSNAFSMYRTEVYNEADKQVEAALHAAEKSIDLIHVNFTAQLICDLNLLYDVCTFDQAMPYLDSLLATISRNDTHLRVLVKSAPIDGVETSVALALFREKIAKRGLEDRVEVRFFNGPMHYKTALIDDEFLIVGSQNYHYSAFGDGQGLAEYSLGTDDPQAIADYQRLFEYQWERAIVPGN